MNKKNENQSPEGKEDKNGLPGYPIYPASEDIYNTDKEEIDLDPENISKRKAPNESGPDKNNEKNFRDDVSGGDLDIPGSESDELEENAGSEDEENNFYSLGGDDHNDLEEDNG
jgi:hypothetical protein